MNNRALAIAALVGSGAYLLSTRSAQAGVRYNGGFYQPDALPDWNENPPLALTNLLATWTLDTKQAIPDYTAVVPGPANYEDALPGSQYWGADSVWQWPQSDTTPWGLDDAETLPADYWITDWGVYDNSGSAWDEGGGRIIPVGNFVSGEKNLQAFLKMIRWAEGTNADDGYQALYGYRPGNGKIFTDFSDHPRISYKTPWGTTSAAGAYQMQAGTWDRAATAMSLPDFSPANQDAAAVWIIDKGRGALGDILAGRFVSAVRKLRKEWASLPSSDSSQPKRSWDDAQRMFLSFGGDIVPGEDTVYV